MSGSPHKPAGLNNIVGSGLHRVSFSSDTKPGDEARGLHPSTAGMQRQDTPWPDWQAWQAGASSPPSSTPAGSSAFASGQQQPTGKMEELRAQLRQAGGAAAGSPPQHAHHAGKPPPPEHSGLDAEEGVGGSLAEELVPPVDEEKT